MIESLFDSLDLDPLLERVSTIGWVQELVLVAGFVVAAIIFDLIINRVITFTVRRTRTDLDDRFVALLHRPIVTSVIGLGLWVVVLRADLAGPARLLIGRLLLTILLVAWAWFLIRAGLLMIETFGRIQDRKQLVERRMLPLAAMLTRALVTAAAIYFLLSLWGINVGPLLGTAGVLGIVLGLAAKDTLANFFAGISIMADAPYEIGDYIVLDTGERGEVIKIGLRSTSILTRDDIEVTIPNSVIGTTKIVNESGGPAKALRVRVNVQAAYGTDIDHLRQVLIEIIEAEPLIADTPRPVVRMRGLGESGVDFQLMGRVRRSEERGRALDSLYDKVYKRLAEEGIATPYPVRHVLLESAAPDAD